MSAQRSQHTGALSNRASFHVVSRASTRGMFKRMVVSCRASLDLPAPGGPKITRDELLCWVQVQSTFLKTGRV
jgi:hypothetical protein